MQFYKENDDTARSQCMHSWPKVHDSHMVKRSINCCTEHLSVCPSHMSLCKLTALIWSILHQGGSTEKCRWAWLDWCMQGCRRRWRHGMFLGGGGTLQYQVQIMGEASWGFWQTYLGPSGRPWAPELILLQVIMWREFEKQAEDYTHCSIPYASCIGSAKEHSAHVKHDGFSK